MNTYEYRKCHVKITVMKWAPQKSTGFTVVELLIVVVVIAILAAITIVSYNGISQRANESSLKNELATAVKKIETLKINSGTSTYPSEIASHGFSASTTLAYYNDANANTFCVESKKGTLVFSATHKNSVVAPVPCSENGLLGWWPLNGSGNDASGNGFDGVLTGTASATGQNGQAGQALGFDSASTSNIAVADHAPLRSRPESFSVWIRPANWSSASASAIISKRPNNTSGYYLSYIAASSAIGFDCGSSTSGNRWITGYNPPLNTWTHLIATCSTNGHLALYVNGALQNSRTTNDRSALSNNSPYLLKIGQDSSTLNQLFNGVIDDVRIYDRVISAGEASALYTAGAQ